METVVVRGKQVREAGWVYMLYGPQGVCTEAHKVVEMCSDGRGKRFEKLLEECDKVVLNTGAAT